MSDVRVVLFGIRNWSVHTAILCCYPGGVSSRKCVIAVDCQPLSDSFESGLIFANPTGLILYGRRNSFEVIQKGKASTVEVLLMGSDIQLQHGFSGSRSSKEEKRLHCLFPFVSVFFPSVAGISIGRKYSSKLRAKGDQNLANLSVVVDKSRDICLMCEHSGNAGVSLSNSLRTLPDEFLGCCSLENYVEQILSTSFQSGLPMIFASAWLYVVYADDLVECFNPYGLNTSLTNFLGSVFVYRAMSLIKKRCEDDGWKVIGLTGRNLVVADKHGRSFLGRKVFGSEHHILAVRGMISSL